MARRSPPNVFSTSTVDLFASALGAAAILFVLTLVNKESAGTSAVVEDSTAFFNVQQYGYDHLRGLKLHLDGLTCSLEIQKTVGSSEAWFKQNSSCTGNPRWNVSGLGSREVVITRSQSGNSQQIPNVHISYRSGAPFAGAISVKLENVSVESKYELLIDMCFSHREPHLLEVLSFDPRGLRADEFFWQKKEALVSTLKDRAQTNIAWIEAFRDRMRGNPALADELGIYMWEQVTPRTRSLVFELDKQGRLKYSVDRSKLSSSEAEVRKELRSWLQAKI